MDALLALMVLAWGLNYTLLKRAFQEIPPHVFNAMRMTLASIVFLGAIRAARRWASAMPPKFASVFYTPQPLTARDWWDLAWLGVVGHCMYQLCFVGGLSRTSASNAALIFGTSPVAIALTSTALGHERIGWLHWLGAVLSATGVYFVVGRGASLAGANLYGDVLVALGVVCWTAYTVGGRRLMSRHSPLYVTGMTMAFGTVPYAVLALPAFFGVRWHDVTATTWVLLVPTALFALCFAYTVWYTAVQLIGPARASIYANALPLIAMLFAAVWLGEPITHVKLVGVAAVLGGVLLTRIRASGPIDREGQRAKGRGQR
jgi:drug/metabolite transporter (DMT)-like permease